MDAPSRMATQPAPPSAQPTSWQMAPPDAATTTGENPMAGQVKAIAVIDMVFGALDALVALAGLLFMSIGAAALRANEQNGVPHWVTASAGAIGVFMFLVFGGIAVVNFLAGSKLLGFRRSGKGLGIAAAVLQVVGGLPFIFAGGLGLVGLGIGIWGLVALTRPDTDRLLVN